MRQPLLSTVCQTSMPKRTPYHSTRSTAVSTWGSASVVSSNHSSGSPPAGGCSSTTYTAQTVTAGSLSARRWRGGRRVTGPKRRLRVAWRGACPAWRGTWTVSVAATGRALTVAHKYCSGCSTRRSQPARLALPHRPRVARPHGLGHHAQRHALGREGERRMHQQPLMAGRAQRPQAGGGRLRPPIQLGRVLHGQHYRHAGRTPVGRGDMAGPERLGLNRLIGQEPIGRFELPPTATGFRQRRSRARRHLAHECEQPLRAPRIAQVGRPKLSLNPVRRLYDPCLHLYPLFLPLGVGLVVVESLARKLPHPLVSGKDVGKDKPLAGEGQGEGVYGSAAAAHSPPS